MKKILIIEDHPMVLANIGKLLKAEGFEVDLAVNGKEGLARAKVQVPDLIISDIMMPELDGYGLLQALRQDPNLTTVPLILLTAKVDRQDLRMGMELGSDDYLTKPFTREELLNSVRTQLKKQEAISDRCEMKLDVMRANISHSLPHRLLFPSLQIMSLADRLVQNEDALSPLQLQETGASMYSAAKDLHDMIKKFLLYAELEVIATDAKRVGEMRSQQTTFLQIELTNLAKEIAQKYNRSNDLQVQIVDGSIAIADSYIEAIAKELIENAFKFSSLGTAVSVTSSQNQDRYHLVVSDRGQGITEQQLAGLGKHMGFEERLYSHQGAGLGFSIVKRLIEIHQGSLEIQSHPYELTTVEVSLPICT